MYQYYFSLLNAEQKNIYKYLLNGIQSFSSEIKLPLRPAIEISNIFNSILLDNPMVFYAKSYRYTSELNRQKVTFMPNYEYSKNSVKSNNSDIMRYLTIFDGIRVKNDIEKELENLIANGLSRGKKSFILKLVNVNNKDTAVEKVVSIAKQQYTNIYKNSFSVGYSCNKDQSAVELNFT